MKTLKLLSMMVFALCLIGSVSAIVVYGDWEDSSQDIDIVEGESIEFNVDFFSINPPMTVNIKLYDSNSKLIHSFETSLVVNSNSHFETYTIDSSVYSRPGYYELVLIGSDSSNSDSHTLDLTIEEIPDNNPPRLILLGQNPVTIYQYKIYTDAGATADDKEDGDITHKIVKTGSVNTNVLGTYTLTYNVKDNADNPATPVTRTVKVVPAPTQNTAPIITLSGKNPVTIYQYDNYVDAGAKAEDKEDGDITHKIVTVNLVNTNKVGIYKINYNVQDSKGKSAVEVTRTVKVISYVTKNTAPKIILLGDSFVKVKLGTSYNDAGAKAWDKEDGDITHKIEVSNPVNTNKVGTYTITYDVQDSKGKSAVEVTRIVKVYKPYDNFPVITVIVPEEDKEYSTSRLTFEVEVNKVAEVKFVLDNGPRIKMNHVRTSNGVLTFKYNVNLPEGDHKVIFYATDTDGNRVSKSVEFSIDLDHDDDDRDRSGRTDEFYSDAYTDELYFDQFKQKNFFYLEEEDQPEKELTWWQRFIEWLKRIFGFN